MALSSWKIAYSCLDQPIGHLTNLYFPGKSAQRTVQTVGTTTVQEHFSEYSSNSATRPKFWSSPKLLVEVSSLMIPLKRLKTHVILFYAILVHFWLLCCGPEKSLLIDFERTSLVDNSVYVQNGYSVHNTCTSLTSCNISLYRSFQLRYVGIFWLSTGLYYIPISSTAK